MWLNKDESITYFEVTFGDWSVKKFKTSNNLTQRFSSGFLPSLPPRPFQYFVVLFYIRKNSFTYMCEQNNILCKLWYFVVLVKTYRRAWKGEELCKGSGRKLGPLSTVSSGGRSTLTIAMRNNCNLYVMVFQLIWQNHRMVGVGRDLCWSCSSTLLPKQAPLAQAAQDLVQAGYQYLQRRRLHNPSLGQPVPGLRHLQSKVLPRLQTEIPTLQFVAGHHWKESGPILLTPTLKKFITIYKVPSQPSPG